jgi:hypothetical protein
MRGAKFEGQKTRRNSNLTQYKNYNHNHNHKNNNRNV